MAAIERRRVRAGVVGGVVGAAIGLVLWGSGLRPSVGDRASRTNTREMVLQQTSALLDENAKQITAQQHQFEMLSASIDRLVADSAEERRATREDLKELRDLTRENSEAIRDLLNLAPRQPAPGRS